MTCSTSLQASQPEKHSLVEVARSDRQWTGVAVAQDNRIFVNYPRWSDNVPFSVGELKLDGSVALFPSMDLNRWEPGSDATRNFVAVQSVVVDNDNFLCKKSQIVTFNPNLLNL